MIFEQIRKNDENLNKSDISIDQFWKRLTGKDKQIFSFDLFGSIDFSEDQNQTETISSN